MYLEMEIRETIDMLRAIQKSLYPVDYLGNEATIIEDIKPESADFVLEKAISLLEKMNGYAYPGRSCDHYSDITKEV